MTKTPDISLAAFLWQSGCPPTEVDRQNPRFSYFHFSNGRDLEEQYHLRLARVEPIDFINRRSALHDVANRRKSLAQAIAEFNNKPK